MNASSTPEGWRSITPRIFVRDPKRLVGFLKHAFSAQGEYRADGPSEIRIGDSIVMVSGPRPDGAEMNAWLYLYDPDVDAAFARALAHGASVIEAPFDTHYGDRRATIKDPSGNTWQIATRQVAAKG
jgi:PhnB protein